MNAQGQPVQVPAGALQAANVQNHIGKIHLSVWIVQNDYYQLTK